MLDIKFLRQEPERVKENIRKKLADGKLHLVDDVIALDEEYRGVKQRADDLRAVCNKLAKDIGGFYAAGDKAAAEAAKEQVASHKKELAELEAREPVLSGKIREIMLTSPDDRFQRAYRER